MNMNMGSSDNEGLLSSGSDSGTGRAPRRKGRRRRSTMEDQECCGCCKNINRVTAYTFVAVLSLSVAVVLQYAIQVTLEALFEHEKDHRAALAWAAWAVLVAIMFVTLGYCNCLSSEDMRNASTKGAFGIHAISTFAASVGEGDNPAQTQRRRKKHRKHSRKWTRSYRHLAP